MSLLAKLEDAVEFAENPEPRCPCVLLLDTSGSMQGEPLDAMLAGLEAFRFDPPAPPRPGSPPSPPGGPKAGGAPRRQPPGPRALPLRPARRPAGRAPRAGRRPG